jgi:hypothetical protein
MSDKPDGVHLLHEEVARLENALERAERINAELLEALKLVVEAWFLENDVRETRASPADYLRYVEICDDSVNNALVAIRKAEGK